MTEAADITYPHASGKPVRTLPEAFQETARLHPEKVALRTPGDIHTVTWGEYAKRVERIAAGLAALGVGHGDTVGIMLANRPEFHLVDTAALHLGAVPFSIYNTSSPDQIAYLFGNAENRVVVTQQAFLSGRYRRRNQGRTRHLRGRSRHRRQHPRRRRGEPRSRTSISTAAWQAVEPADLATLIYTSGTTGPPKGVEITHRNLVAVGGGATPGVPSGFRGQDHLLPPRGAHRGPSLGACDQPDLRHADHLGRRPARDRCCAARRPPDHLLRGPAGVAEDQGRHRGEARRRAERGQEEPRDLGARSREGLRAPQGQWPGHSDRSCRCSTASPTPWCSRRSVTRWASTRSSSPSCGAAADADRGADLLPRPRHRDQRGVGHVGDHRRLHHDDCPDEYALGTVGKAVDGVELKLAADGELLVRGPVIMRGYRGQPEKTAETIDADGWLATGDIAHDRRRGLRDDHRPQEGTDHQRGRQEHVADQHRERDEGRPRRSSGRRSRSATTGATSRR